jgi:hypothetical protein
MVSMDHMTSFPSVRVGLIKQGNATRDDFSIDGSKPTENDVVV